MKFFHISHTDLDGYGCQLITKEYFKEGSFYNANYGLEVKLSIKKVLEDLLQYKEEEIFILITDLNLTFIEAKELDKDVNDLNRYKIMSGSIVPRPIAWIVTEDNGVLNAAPFSYFIPISTNPALVIVAIGRKENESPKDTLANILKTKKATICFPNKDNVDQVQKCATQLPKNLS